MIVFLDIGATLIDGPSETPARLLARRFGLADDQRRAIDLSLLTGRISGRQSLLDTLVGDYGAAPQDASGAVDEVWDQQTHGPAAIPGGAELLESLERAGISYGFISNIWQPYAESFFRLYGPLATGRQCLFSYRLGVAKPDPAVYRAALAVTGNAAAECVMVGDSYDNDIAPAIAVGMRTVWLMHRPDKERRFAEDAASGRLPGADLTMASIADLSPSAILDLMKHSHSEVAL